MARGGAHLPRPRSGEAWESYVERLVRDIEISLSHLADAGGNGPYAVSNLAVEARTLDAAAATTGEVRDVLATLITDLQRRGDIAQ